MRLLTNGRNALKENFSIIFRQMRFMARSAKKGFSQKKLHTIQKPYSASKASSDHMVRAYNHTFGVPAVISIVQITTGQTSFLKAYTSCNK